MKIQFDAELGAALLGFSELVDEGHRDFVLNLAGVQYIDSFGLGQLVSI